MHDHLHHDQKYSVAIMPNEYVGHDDFWTPSNPFLILTSFRGRSVMLLEYFIVDITDADQKLVQVEHMNWYLNYEAVQINVTDH